MAQDNKDNTGFTLPPPQTVASEPSSQNTVTQSSPEVTPSVANGVGTDTSSRDMLIGGGILLVLFIAFFFAKNAYANMLVGKRLPPNKANSSSWWLFIFLASLATGVVLVAVSPARFLAPQIIGPLIAIGIVGLILALISARR